MSSIAGLHHTATPYRNVPLPRRLPKDGQPGQFQTAPEGGGRLPLTEQRRQVRQERSRPIVEALHGWLQDHVGRVSAASGLAEAIRYALRHWPGLVVLLDDGRVEMDTNPVERAVRPVALIRKNTLFAGGGGGGHWVSIR